MKKRLLIYTFIVLICLFTVLYLYFNLLNKSKDSYKFKMEYEKYNNKLISIKINSKNPVKYSSYNELIEIIEDGTGVILLGEPKSQSTRNIIPVLFDVLNDYKIDTLYYLNIKDDMDYYIINDGEVIYDIDENGKELKGNENYFKLVNYLDSYLSTFDLVLDDKTYSIDEKRIILPSVIFVQDGNILGLYAGTLESNYDINSPLTDIEKKELYKIYEDYIKMIKS